ncbi:hypothetical protein Tco_0391193 [Tanacetum coccineum]
MDKTKAQKASFACSDQEADFLPWFSKDYALKPRFDTLNLAIVCVVYAVESESWAPCMMWAIESESKIFLAGIGTYSVPSRVHCVQALRMSKASCPETQVLSPDQHDLKLIN